MESDDEPIANLADRTFACCRFFEDYLITGGHDKLVSINSGAGLKMVEKIVISPALNIYSLILKSRICNLVIQVPNSKIDFNMEATQNRLQNKH